ncbi:MAG: N-acetylneuraminate lyase [Helicobacter sp.]|mgnify:CR=1 FL=1|nr:N-acetylneuraminate lyase [Helicobacter sp.]
MKDLKGIYSALLVSFDSNGKINEKGLRQIIRHNIDNMRIDGLYVGGSSGENFLLSTEEKKQILKITKDEAKESIKLIAQVGSLNLHESCELGVLATDLGYDALSAVTPFYYKFNFAEIKNYYERIIKASQNYMIIYSIPFLTGTNINIEQFKSLYENEKIIGVKFTAADFFLLERLKKTFPKHLIFAGFDEMLLSASTLGIDGAIGSTFNINAKRAKRIWELAKSGKITEALKLQNETNDIIECILQNGLYQSLKELLKLQGIEAGFCREPMTKDLTNEQKNIIKELKNKYL